MSPSSLHRLVRHLRTRPDDLAAWVELGRGVRRANTLPEGLDPRLLPGLLEAWRGAPEERGLHPLFLSLAGLRQPPRAPAAPPPPHPGVDDIRGEGASCWDGRSGLPFWVERPRDGRLMALVPGNVGDPPLYLDLRPLPRSSWERFRRAAAPGAARSTGPWLAHGACYDAIPPETAGAYARWASARLPEEPEWARVRSASRGLRYPWAGARIRIDAPPRSHTINLLPRRMVLASPSEPRCLRLARGLEPAELPSLPLWPILRGRPACPGRRARGGLPRMNLLELLEDLDVPTCA